MNMFACEDYKLRICEAGKVKRPEKSSASYSSAVGLVDTRVDLDKNIKQNDAKYKGFLSMMASKISYENENFLCNAVQNHWNVSSYSFLIN